jgi:hypothetical protein
MAALGYLRSHRAWYAFWSTMSTWTWNAATFYVGYDNVQFTKAPNVLRGMGLAHLSKNDNATRQLTDKGMGPD